MIDIVDNFSTGHKWAVKDCNIYEVDMMNSYELNKLLKSKKYDDFSINLGFGSFEEKNFFKSILHFLFSRILFGLEIFKSEETKVYKNIFNIMNRQIDVDAMRHIYTFNKLNYIQPKFKSNI